MNTTRVCPRGFSPFRYKVGSARVNKIQDTLAENNNNKQANDIIGQLISIETNFTNDVISLETFLTESKRLEDITQESKKIITNFFGPQNQLLYMIASFINNNNRVFNYDYDTDRKITIIKTIEGSNRAIKSMLDIKNTIKNTSTRATCDELLNLQTSYEKGGISRAKFRAKFNQIYQDLKNDDNIKKFFNAKHEVFQLMGKASSDNDSGNLKFTAKQGLEIIKDIKRNTQIRKIETNAVSEYNLEKFLK